MKRLLKITPAILTVIYLVVNIYLLVINWSIFKVSLNIDYGFGTLDAPPIIIMMIFGIVVLILFWLTNYTKDLRYEVDLMKKDEEINRLRSEKQSHLKNNRDGSQEEIKDALFTLQKQVRELQEAIIKERGKVS